jgi:mycothiol synthase
MDALKERAYAGAGDLEKMRNLLIAGRRAKNGTYYVHTGDLNWWLFYPPIDQNLWQYITVWDDPDNRERLLGWALLSPEWNTFDIPVQPELRGSLIAESMYHQAEEQITRLTRTQKNGKIRMMWVSQNDGILIDHLLGGGFERAAVADVYMTRTLKDPIPEPSVPEGIIVRPIVGTWEVEARAAAQYGAFDSKIPFERYVQRFLEFMQSPIYNHELDIVAASIDGRIGSFCIAWTDPVNHVGLFEPVGTHPAFRGRGMGKAAMLEGLRQLQVRGMQTAIVSTIENNLPAIKLYESVGFTTVDKHLTFEKLI